MNEWIAILDALPPEGMRVDWIARFGNLVCGGLKGPGTVWFWPSGHEYSYVEILFWRPAKSEANDA